MVKKRGQEEVVYKILAVLLAILLWFYVLNLDNPTVEKPFSVSVEPLNLAPGLALVEPPGNVEVRVRGTSLNALNSREIKAVVNLAGAKLGEGTYWVSVSLPAGVELVAIRPASLNLHIDEIKEKQLPIRVITQGTVAPGYSYFEPVLEPSTVVVRGASGLLADLDTALITVNVEQAKDNLVLNPPVTLLTKKGEIVSGQFEISPQNIQVFVPITENTDSKTVAIKPNIKGGPAEGFRVARVILDPETVRITGSYEALSQIYQVNTAPIDITGIKESYSTQVALIPPEGVSLLYQPVVKVLVQVEAITVVKDFTDVPITVLNLAGDDRVALKTDKVQVSIKGPRTDMEVLEKSEIKAFIDVADLKPGVHNLAVKIELPSNLQVEKMEPQRIEVTLSKVEVEED